MSARVVGALHIGVATMVKVSALAVSAVASVAHHGASVVDAGNVPVAVQSTMDRDAVSLDGANVAVFAEGRLAAALHRDGFASGRLVMIRIGPAAITCVGTATIAGIVAAVLVGVGAATIAGVVAAVLVGVGSAAIAGVVAAVLVSVGSASIVRSRVSSSIGVSTGAAILRARLSASAVGRRAAWTAVLRAGMTGVSAAGTTIGGAPSAGSLTAIAARVLCRGGMLRGGGMLSRGRMLRRSGFGRPSGLGGRRSYGAHAEYD